MLPVDGWLVAPELGVAWVPEDTEELVLPVEALVAPADDTAAPPVVAEELAVVSVVDVAVVGVTEADAAAAPPGMVSAGAPEVSADGVPEELPHAAIAAAESRPAASAPSVASEGRRSGTY